MSKVEFQRLREAWERAHPRRATGGVVSVRGFLYQFQSALRDAVRAWAADPTSVVHVESVSDIAGQRPGGRWTITQVKRTGSSAAFDKALEELWTVYEIAIRETPALAPRLTFEIRCARWELVDVARVLSNWAPATSTPQDVLGAFRAQVMPTIDPHPLHDLVEDLVRHTGAVDPLAFAERWTARLMHGTASAEDLGVELLAALTALARTQDRLPEAVRLVPARIAAPDEVRLGDYLMGEQPRLSHLEQGYFAPRAWQVEPVVRAFREWLAADPFGTDRERRLPVFWIAGRSGSGKSVLLLQAMVRLIQSGIDPMLWLANRYHLLPVAMRWAVQACRAGEHPIIAIDDPFAPGDLGDAIGHWRTALDEVDRLRDESDAVPVILACGPSEQAAGAEREFRADVCVQRWHLDDRLDSDHVVELSAWFLAARATHRPISATATSSWCSGSSNGAPANRWTSSRSGSAAGSSPSTPTARWRRCSWGCSP
jgi:hypothetical protein